MFLFLFFFSLQLPLIFTLLLGSRVELIGINGGELNSRNLSSCWSGLPEKIIKVKWTKRKRKKKAFLLVGDGLDWVLGVFALLFLRAHSVEQANEMIETIQWSW
ncbi:hypothetical protein B9Z19DRAFT_1090080 [Tuber borchii]|uniref:Uncharacterized protein n=1 Tax=Tuber borchii TaxID=42251 RepID=A0A2T6ZJA4_TUBBO|nr:hypothetical protein B9Z19DRAFT_1090080 [Tuber borchii]